MIACFSALRISVCLGARVCDSIKLTERNTAEYFELLLGGSLYLFRAVRGVSHVELKVNALLYLAKRTQSFVSVSLCYCIIICCVLWDNTQPVDCIALHCQLFVTFYSERALQAVHIRHPLSRNPHISTGHTPQKMKNLLKKL